MKPSLHLIISFETLPSFSTGKINRYQLTQTTHQIFQLILQLEKKLFHLENQYSNQFYLLLPHLFYPLPFHALYFSAIE